MTIYTKCVDKQHKGKYIFIRHIEIQTSLDNFVHIFTDTIVIIIIVATGLILKKNPLN